MTQHDEDVNVIDLGTASEVTRGQALVNDDIGGGKLNFASGIADD